MKAKQEQRSKSLKYSNVRKDMKYGLDLSKRYLCLPGKRNPENLFLLVTTTVILRYIHLRTTEEVLHVLPGH